MIVALYGPPGSGKSTIVQTAISEKLLAFDAEELGENYQERLSNAKKIFVDISDKEMVLFGAADLRPDDFPKDTKFVLILPPFEKYLERVQKRDKLKPNKSGQNGPEFKYKEFAERLEHFDLKITENLTPVEVLEKIINFFK